MIEINISQLCGNFAEDKDIAKKYRDEIIKPTLGRKEIPVRIDFSNIDSSTQSFIHALLSEIFQNYGENALEFFEFFGCNNAIKSLITTVINYSLE